MCIRYLGRRAAQQCWYASWWASFERHLPPSGLGIIAHRLQVFYNPLPSIHHLQQLPSYRYLATLTLKLLPGNPYLAAIPNFKIRFRQIRWIEQGKHERNQLRTSTTRSKFQLSFAVLTPKQYTLLSAIIWARLCAFARVLHYLTCTNYGGRNCGSRNKLRSKIWHIL